MQHASPLLEPLEVPRGCLVSLALAPIIMPLVVIGAILAAIGVGISGLVASSGGGALGAAIGVVFLALIVGYGYHFLPLICFLALFFVYVLICGFEEITGQRLVAPVSGVNVQLRIISFMGTLATGLVSFLVFWGLNVSMGWSESEYIHSKASAVGAMEAYEGTVSNDIQLLQVAIEKFGTEALLVVLATAAWWLIFYIGGNYWFSRSLWYCLHIFVLAFFIDILATMAFYFTSNASSTPDLSSFFASVNALDHELRRIAMLPIEALVSTFSNFEFLVHAMTRLFGSITDAMYTLIEIGLRIVTINLDELREKLQRIVDFARFLRVDFLSFAAASLIQLARLRLVRS